GRVAKGNSVVGVDNVINEAWYRAQRPAHDIRDRPVDAPKALLAPPDALVELRTECLDGSGELRGLHSDSLGDLAPECRILKSARWRTRVGPQRGLAEQRVR